MAPKVEFARYCLTEAGLVLRAPDSERQLRCRGVGLNELGQKYLPEFAGYESYLGHDLDLKRFFKPVRYPLMAVGLREMKACFHQSDSQTQKGSSSGELGPFVFLCANGAAEKGISRFPNDFALRQPGFAMFMSPAQPSLNRVNLAGGEAKTGQFSGLAPPHCGEKTGGQQRGRASRNPRLNQEPFRQQRGAGPPQGRCNRNNLPRRHDGH